ncbi:MAG: magnesium transporter, partial [Desulfobulbaceae bacterium]|nr:magnesium transporter [Desulfobulbaceae bacterium]
MVKGNAAKRELLGKEGAVILDTIRRLNRRNAVDNLLKVLKKTHPADIAWVFRHLTSPERKTVFNVVAKTDMVGDLMAELDQAIALEVVDGLTPKFMVSIIKEMASDDAAELLDLLPYDTADDIRHLMHKDDLEE